MGSNEWIHRFYYYNVQNFVTEHELPEFRVLKEYYNKLTNILPACDLSHYFVSENLVTVRDHEEIINPVTSPQMAVLLLLNRVGHSLQTNSDVEVFKKMLAIMECHGNSAIKHLSLEIRARILEETNKSNTSNVGQQGMYTQLYCKG